jgi:hypothetical protein
MNAHPEYSAVRVPEIARFIAKHEAEIAYQRTRITPSAATSTLYLANQRILAAEGAIRALRRELAEDHTA